MDYYKLKQENYNKIQKYNTVSENEKNIGIVDFYPKYIQIEQTNCCNAQCIMCNHFYIENKGGTDISDMVIDKLTPILPYCETVMLNGDGEPFLSKSIVNNIKHYSKYDLEIGTNTNLSYVPEELWSYINQYFGFLNISCDGASKSTYELIRRGLLYEQFVANLSRLHKEAPSLKRNIDCVVMKQNILDLPNIVKLAANYGILSVRFHELGVNPCIGNHQDSAELYMAQVKEQLDEAIQIGKKYGIKVVCPQYPAFSVDLYRLEIPEQKRMRAEIDERQKKAKALYGMFSLENDYYSELITYQDLSENLWDAEKNCQWAIERCYIDIKGNVTTCCYNMKKYMGNLLEQSFDDIWNGEKYRLFRKNMKKNMLPAFCSGCNWIKNPTFQ